MGVLRRRYHVSPIAHGLSTGPCRVSNLLGLSKTQGRGVEQGEAERFLFAHFEMPARPDLSAITASGPGAP